MPVHFSIKFSEISQKNNIFLPSEVHLNISHDKPWIMGTVKVM